MTASFETDLYRRILAELNAVQIIDCHEHLQHPEQMQTGDDIHFGRFLAHYANCDLVSAGMPISTMERARTDPGISPAERWELIEPWYGRTWNTAYWEALRIAARDIYGVEEFCTATMDTLHSAMQERVKPGITREVFDMAGIDYAMNNPLERTPVFDGDFDADSFICDMTDAFTSFPLADLEKASGISVSGLRDYLQVIDWHFEKYAHAASAFKCGRAYSRTLFFEDVAEADAARVFDMLLSDRESLSESDLMPAEDFILHYLCRKCGEYDLRMKFHTGIQEGNGNTIGNSRAGLLNNLFLKYPGTKFDIYHVSYPYEEELAVLAKNFQNVTVNFCWMWIINPAAGRRALADMLDTVPANKIHGFGGDYIFVEGTYGHAVIARREIARVLAKKVEEGRFPEEYAVKVGEMLLRSNAIENFDLTIRRAAFRKLAQ